MQEVGDTAEQPILWDEGAAGLASEEGAEGGVVVKEQMDGGASAEGGEGERTVGCKEFSCLLGEDPWGAGEEAGAHGVFPNANVEQAPRGAGRVGIKAGCCRGNRGPSW